MILRLHIRRASCVCLALASSPALADVLEIDGNEAVWVSAETVTPSAPFFSYATQLPDSFDTTSITAGDRAQQGVMVPAPYRAKVLELAMRYDLSPALIEALVWQESRWRNDARSSAGALGLTQLMPGTAREMGVDPADPFMNLEGGARYLRTQLDRFDGDLVKALAAYNAGPNRVVRSGGVPPIRETRNYIAGIMARLASHSMPEGEPVADSRSSN